MSKTSDASKSRAGRIARSGPASTADIGVMGALSIGIGGIIGGGFFATSGLAVVGARGSTYLSFLLGGILALLTAYSYVRLTLRYTEPGGTVLRSKPPSFPREEFPRQSGGIDRDRYSPSQPASAKRRAA